MEKKKKRTCLSIISGINEMREVILLVNKIGREPKKRSILSEDHRSKKGLRRHKKERRQGPRRSRIEKTRKD